MVTTTTFVGERLRRARIARMMTGVALAEEVGVSPAAITKFEKGAVSPREEIIRRLAEVLRVPPMHFFNPVPSDGKAPVRMRSLSAATKRARASAEVRVDWLREIVAYLDAVMPLPLAELPDLCEIDDPAQLAEDDIEDLATALRRAWGMQDGPIANLTDLLESKGCAVSYFALGAEALDAFGKWTPEAPIIVENTDRMTAVRMRFDLAHELGHLVIHRHVPEPLAFRPEIHSLMERQAHRFAGAFVFPATSFANEVYSVSVGGLTECKRRWKLSIQAMIRRARDLRMISKEQYARALRTLSGRGFRKREPLDDELPIEVPRQLPDRIRCLVEERGFTVEEIEAHTRHRRREIEALTALPPGYFDSPAARKEGGKVIPLRR